MIAQAERAEKWKAVENGWYGSSFGSKKFEEEGEKEGAEEAPSYEVRRLEEPHQGPWRSNAEESAARRRADEQQQEKGCDLCLMITEQCRSYNPANRPYYLPPLALDPKNIDRDRDVPLVFGRTSKPKMGGGMEPSGEEWEFRIVCLSSDDIFAADVAAFPRNWRKFRSFLVLFFFFFFFFFFACFIRAYC